MRELTLHKGDLFMLLFFAAIIGWFAIPAVYSGADNGRVIAHFNWDEEMIVNLAGKLYQRGATPIEYTCGYPQLFFYLAGAVLFPYTWIKGLDIHTIVCVLRGFNVLIAIATVLLLYIFVIRFFKSRITAALSCLILCTTPIFLRMAVHSKPHLLNVLFTLAAFYFCFLAAEKYKLKYMVLAAAASGLSMSANFFGFFLIPSICLTYAYHIAKLKTDELIADQKKRGLFIYIASSLVMFVGVLVPAAAVFAYYRFSHLFAKKGVDAFSVFLASRMFRMFALVAAVIFMTGLLWWILNLTTGRLVRMRRKTGGPRFLLAMNSCILFLFTLVLVSGAVFVILNPTYLLFPAEAVKITVNQFGFTAFGASLTGAAARSFLSPGAFDWAKKLFIDNAVFNGWLGSFFLIYLVYELLNIGKARNRDQQISRRQRIILLTYLLSLMAVLFMFVMHRTHHYLLPAIPVIAVLSSFGVVEIVKKIRSAWARYIVIAVLSVLALAGFCERASGVIELRHVMADKNSDTGIVIGRYLEENFGRDTVIWKDSTTYYVPQKFKNVNSMYYDQDISGYFAKIRDLEPDLIIITSEGDSSLANLRKVEKAIEDGRLKGFKKLAGYTYSGPYAIGNSSYGIYKEICIFRREDS